MVRLDQTAIPLSQRAAWLDLPQTSLRYAMAAAREGKLPALDVGTCVAAVGPSEFLRVLWQEVSGAAQLGELELGRSIATHALTCPPTRDNLPLLPLFLKSNLTNVFAAIDLQLHMEQTTIELLVAVIISSLTAVLQMEWALRTVDSGADDSHIRSIHPVGQPSASMARHLATDLRRSQSPAASIVLQRLSSSTSFVNNFPMMG